MSDGQSAEHTKTNRKVKQTNSVIVGEIKNENIINNLNEIISGAEFWV